MKAPLCRVDEIPKDGALAVDFFGRPVVVLQVGHEPKAFLNMCMHLGGPMRRHGDRLVCEWHGAEFEGSDGHCLKPPAAPDARLITLPTRVENGLLTYVYGE
jgi:apoptosis-inducing factor 3